MPSGIEGLKARTVPSDSHAARFGFNILLYFRFYGVTKWQPLAYGTGDQQDIRDEVRQSKPLVGPSVRHERINLPESGVGAIAEIRRGAAQSPQSLSVTSLGPCRACAFDTCRRIGITTNRCAYVKWRRVVDR
jgi:hypothetical protein